VKYFVILFGLILSRGCLICFFHHADSTIPSSKSISDYVFTTAIFADKYNNVEFSEAEDGEI